MIELDGHDLTLSGLGAIATGSGKCALTAPARERMQESRRLVEQFAGEPRAIYGINTGFGPLSAHRVADGDLERHQMNLLHHLSVGQGELFNREETRAIMAVRANALARGYSGIQVATVELLVDLLNHDILPEIPNEGSVGASGDLVPLAHMARLLVGLGHARVKGERLPAGEALKAHGLEPRVLQCKEGLALVNGTSAMTGLAALSVIDARALLLWSEFLSACYFQLLEVSPEFLCGQVHKARGFRGQFESARRLARLLQDHPRYAREIAGHEWGAQAKPKEAGVEIQDPYSARCAPQILGAVQESLWHVEQVVTREMNASTDNPLIFPDSGSVIHCGNFYGQQIAMVSDYLRLGLTKLAILLDRQLERLVNWRYSPELPPMLTGSGPGLNSGFSGCQLLATSLVAECRMACTPASVQSIPTNANNQDVVSMGCIAAKQTQQVVTKLWRICAIQALAVAQAAELHRDPEVAGEGFRNFQKQLHGISPPLREDRPLYEDIAAVVQWLKQSGTQEEFIAGPDPRNDVEG